MRRTIEKSNFHPKRGSTCFIECGFSNTSKMCAAENVNKNSLLEQVRMEKIQSGMSGKNPDINSDADCCWREY